MHIKDMPVNERPQEKLLYGGVSSLSTAELVALIIRTGNGDKSAVQLAEDVLSYASSESGSLGRIDARELTNIDGIGVTKACSIIASIELAKRISHNDILNKKQSMLSTSEAAGILMEELRHEKREHLVAYLLNSKCEIEAKETISIGALSTTTIHPREVLSPAIRRGAAGIIIAHNHPSGDPTPSREDIEATMRIAEAAKIVGIKLLDHIIVGNSRYVSLKDEGIIL